MATATERLDETLGGPWRVDTLDKLELIWRTLMRDVTRFEGEVGHSTTNSKRWSKIDDTLEELSAMLVEEVNDIGPGSTEVDLQRRALDDIWQAIEKRMLEFGLEVEARRAVARRDAADLIAPYKVDQPDKAQLTPA